MEQKPLVIILADISGYTRFMLDNQTAAVHGQLMINSLIEALLQQVDIPLTLQEIEGDAIFLYAVHPGSDASWQEVVLEVSRKLDGFFRAFVTQWGINVEAGMCECAICANADKLGLKIIVHAGEALFHELRGRPQVSSTDVILAHRLLKNSVAGREYLLVTEAAWALMAAHLPGRFEPHRETYEGFGVVDVRVRDLDGELQASRDAVRELRGAELAAAADSYVRFLSPRKMRAAALQQLRRPTRTFPWRQRLRMLFEALVVFPFASLLVLRRSTAGRLAARGRRSA